MSDIIDKIHLHKRELDTFLSEPHKATFWPWEIHWVIEAREKLNKMDRFAAHAVAERLFREFEIMEKPESE